jgi:hypothetical protein
MDNWYDLPLGLKLVTVYLVLQAIGIVSCKSYKIINEVKFQNKPNTFTDNFREDFERKSNISNFKTKSLLDNEHLHNVLDYVSCLKNAGLFKSNLIRPCNS